MPEQADDWGAWTVSALNAKWAMSIERWKNQILKIKNQKVSSQKRMEHFWYLIFDIFRWYLAENSGVW